MESCELPEIGSIVFDSADVIPDSQTRGPEIESLNQKISAAGAKFAYTP